MERSEKIQELYRVIVGLSNVEDCAALLDDLCTHKEVEKMAERLKTYGLDAIEAYYPTHKPADTKYIKTIAQKYGLGLSGGSDFHGSIKPGLDLGTGYGDLAVPYEVLENIGTNEKIEM